MDRYDYLHEMEQLEPRGPHIREADLKAARVRMYFDIHARSESMRERLYADGCS